VASDRLTSTSAQAQLDDYLAELATRLRGPRRRRQLILAELRDGLDEAIADNLTAGLTEDRAVTVTIAGFGSPQAVANAFAGELATAYARRTIAWYILTGPLVGIWWLLLLQPHPWRTGVLALLAAIPVLPLIGVAILTAGGTIATTGRLMHWFPEASPQRALIGTTIVAALALAGDLTVITLYLLSDTPLTPLAIPAIAASLIRIVCSLIAVRHITEMRRHLTGIISQPQPQTSNDNAQP
jgi:MFS family permease